MFSFSTDTHSSMTFNFEVDDDEPDLGEPVEDLRVFPSAGWPTPTIAHSKEVSGLKRNLTLKFDLETRKANARRKSNDRLVVRRLTRSLHRRGNAFFIKKTQCRFTLRALLATKDFKDCSTRRLHVLVKCLSFSVREGGALPNQREMLLRLQHLLQRELNKRNVVERRRKKDEASSPSLYKNVHENDRKHTDSKHLCATKDFKIVEENSKLGRLLEDGIVKNPHKCGGVKICKRRTRKANERRKSNDRLVVRRLRRSLHRRGNTFFIKKTQCRFTLRALLATKDFKDCSTRRLHVLVKCLSFSVREGGALPNQREMLLRLQHLLQRELNKRNVVERRRKKDEASSPSVTFGHSSGICGEEENDKMLCSQRNDGREFVTRRKTDEHRDTVQVDKKSWAGKKKMKVCSSKNVKKCGSNLLFFERRLSDHKPDERFQRIRNVDPKNSTFSKENQGTKTDEIDDIFSSL